MEKMQQTEEPVLETFLKEDGIIYTAFKNGYYYSDQTPLILRGKEGKTAILQYLDLQKNGEQINWFPRYIDPSVLEDEKFKENYIRFLIQKRYELRTEDDQTLLQDARLARIFYERKLEHGEDITYDRNNILNPSLIRQFSFMEQYIHMLKQKGIGNETILDTLTHSQACAEEIKKNPNLFQFIFHELRGDDLSSFFNRFFTQEELQQFFSKDISWQGEMQRFRELYQKDPTIIKTLEGKLLDERYQVIPLYKMQILAKQKMMQKQILGLSDFQLKLYQKMTEKISQKTTRWNRFEENIIGNLSEDGFYGELLSDLYEQSKKGDLITGQEMENLLFLFSRKSSSRAIFKEYLMPDYQAEGLSKKEIAKAIIVYADMIFPITTKEELRHFQEIRELVCDTVLLNPELDDEQLTKGFQKYLVAFEDLSSIDRMKLALMEKYYNMSLREAEEIIQKFGVDIDQIKAR